MIIVTGGTGFIGSNLVAGLEAIGAARQRPAAGDAPMSKHASPTDRRETRVMALVFARLLALPVVGWCAAQLKPASAVVICVHLRASAVTAVVVPAVPYVPCVSV